jgi:glycine cleavage system H protein
MAEIRGCQFPDDLFYDADLNLWLKPMSEDTWEVGITEFGGALVGDIYMFNPKPMNRDLELDEPFGWGLTKRFKKDRSVLIVSHFRVGLFI